MNKIYFVRHGETIANKNEIFRGREDIPLNEIGKRQALEAAEYLDSINFDLVFSSPLSRAYETAKIISKRNDITKDELINNLDVGDWSGKKKSLVSTKNPEEWELWKKNPEIMEFPHGNSISYILKQTKKFLNKLENFDNKTILVVSHRSVIKCIFANILNLEKDFFWKFYFNNASFSNVNFDVNFGYTIINMNESCYLSKFIRENH